jgi:large subunit ribosomal protein L4
VVVLEDFTFDSVKTKNYINLVNALNLAGEKTLLVLPSQNNNIYLSSRNIQKAKVITAADLNTYDVLNAGKLLLTADSLKTLEEAFAK